VPPQFRAEVTLRVRSLRDRQTGDSRIGAWILFAAVAAMLILACTNVTNLLLVRAAVRQREFAVRAALGAGRGRLLRQTLTESLLLALCGGLAGWGVAYLLLHAFISIAPQGIVRLEQASLDLRVLGFGFILAVFCGVVLGIASALSKPEPEVLCGRSLPPVGGLFRNVLVSAQIAASLILLAGAGMLLRSLWNIVNVPIGLEVERVVTAQVALADHRYPDTLKQHAFLKELEGRLGRLPGAGVLAISDTLPPSGGTQATFFASIEVPGRPRLAQGTGGMVGWRLVTPSYFPALSIPIVRGRAFTEADRAPTEQPVILSESLAAKLFPGDDPCGKMIRFVAFDRRGPWRTVVGVAGNVKNNGLTTQSDPEFYIPWKDDMETYVGRAFVIFRTSLSARSIASWTRSQIAEIDPTVPVEFGTMNSRVGRLAARPRFEAMVLTTFALMGILMAGLGIYGVVSFFVSQRTKEIGVRMALGATSSGISRMVLKSMALWTSSGAMVGLAVAWFSARLMESLLFEVRTHDPMSLLGALGILVLVALLAAWIPARRAARVDPMVALRYE